MTQWVQSKYSKDAKKWEVEEEAVNYYVLPDGYYLLKSEYIPCEPPERWETCTREVVEVGDGRRLFLRIPELGTILVWHASKDFRLHLEGDALVIQRLVQS